jgi:O-antigen/teichoic acid export membrane protein
VEIRNDRDGGAMMKETRTSKSIKNSQVAILYYCLFLILTFFSRQVFMQKLGAEVLGLNTTVVNLLGFLNLAELGINAAVSFSLYKPLADGDHAAVNDIISVQGWLYRHIAFVVLGASAVLMCFFPMIFAKAEVPLWYAYASFGVLLFAALADYVFNYRQIVVTADQRDYRLMTVTQSAKNGKVLLQIVAIALLPWGYVWWLALEFISSLATIFGIRRLLKHRYPWLETDVAAGGRLRKLYPQIVTKTKQMFFHKIGGFVLFQTSPVVIYGFTSLTVVAIYGNYMFIVLGVIALLNALLNSVTAGVGNLLATADREKALRFFGELFSFRFLLACTACTAMWLLAPAFIELWVGGEYLLDDVSLGLLVAILYIMLTRGAVDTFINASGLFHDIWAPVAEAAINLSASILLGWMFGLPGILAGVLLSLVVVVKGWKPWFLFSRYLHAPFRRYLGMYARNLAALAVALAIYVPLVRLVGMNPADSWPRFALCAAMVSVSFAALLGGSLYLFDRGMRDIAARIMLILKLKTL